MVLASLNVEKRLQSRRAVKRIAKNVRASIRSPRWYDISHDFWLKLEKSQQDDFTRICSRKLLLVRLELKEILRGLNAGESSVDDLITNTTLNKESILAVLRKHGYGAGKEDYDINKGAAAAVYSNKGNNVTFDLPMLDMSDVRSDKISPETPEALQAVVKKPDHGFDAHTPLCSLVEDGAVFVGESPREVTDSSAEISDLAKQLGARLCQERSLLDQLRNASREKSFVEQLREVVTSSSTTQTTVKQFHFIPSKPLSKASLPVTIHCKETDVQTSIRFETPVVAVKEMRDIATDLPSLDYLSMSELGALQQLPEAFVIQEDVSSSTVSSDQSAGQVSSSFKSRMKTTISIARDGSAQFVPSKTVRLSKFFEESSSNMTEEEPLSSQTPCRHNHLSSAVVTSLRIPHVHESPWRPSSRRLRLEEVDISTSQEDSDSLEVISIGTLKCRPNKQNDSCLIGANVNAMDVIQGKSRGESESDLLTKEYSEDSSHQDDEHTYNQVSQIISE